MHIFGIAVLVVLVIWLIAGLTITGLIFKKSYASFDIDRDKYLYHWEDYEGEYQRREVRFDSHGNTLIGHVYEVEAPKGLIVFSHGIWSGEEEYLMMLTWFMDHGWDSFAYSYASYNGSEGKSAKGLPQSPIDLDSALTYIESDPELSKMKKVVMGHSWGAYATSTALRYGHDVKAAVAMSGFNDPVAISVSVAKGMMGVVGLTMTPFIMLFDKVLFGARDRDTAVEGINMANVPVLLTHGTRDNFIHFKTTSIVSRKDKFKNPYVEYIILDDPLQSGHNDFFLNADATKYTNGLDEQVAKMKAGYKKKELPLDVKREFLSKVDKVRANQPNEDFFNQVEEFLDRVVQ